MYNNNVLLFVIVFLFASPSLSFSTNKYTNNNNNHNNIKTNNYYNKQNSNSSSNNIGFDINEAYTQLMYSYSAYCPTAKVKAWDCYFCNYNVSDTKGFVMNTTFDHPATNTFAYIGVSGTTVEVAFRGTQPASLVNWVSDFDFAHLKPYSDIPNAYVHSGFMDAYDTVKVAMRAAVVALVQSSKATRVVFTGHSLGAALTTLCAMDIAPLLKVPSVVYNFGSPRVGNQVFSDYFYQMLPNTFRIVNKADIVPHLPIKDMGFHHVAQEVWWKTATTYVVCDQSGEDKKCSDSLDLTNIQDHLDYLNIGLDKGGC